MPEQPTDPFRALFLAAVESALSRGPNSESLLELLRTATPGLSAAELSGTNSREKALKTLQLRLHPDKHDPATKSRATDLFQQLHSFVASCNLKRESDHEQDDGFFVAQKRPKKSNSGGGVGTASSSASSSSSATSNKAPNPAQNSSCSDHVGGGDGKKKSGATPASSSCTSTTTSRGKENKSSTTSKSKEAGGAEELFPDSFNCFEAWKFLRADTFRPEGCPLTICANVRGQIARGDAVGSQFLFTSDWTGPLRSLNKDTEKNQGEQTSSNASSSSSSSSSIIDEIKTQLMRDGPVVSQSFVLRTRFKTQHSTAFASLPVDTAVSVVIYGWTQTTTGDAWLLWPPANSMKFPVPQVCATTTASKVMGAWLNSHGEPISSNPLSPTSSAANGTVLVGFHQFGIEDSVCYVPPSTLLDVPWFRSVSPYVELEKKQAIEIGGERFVVSDSRPDFLQTILSALADHKIPGFQAAVEAGTQVHFFEPGHKGRSRGAMLSELTFLPNTKQWLVVMQWAPAE
ncbi:unnamed protein product [Amoebophrya sp. A25]|nr:unnamed protein product [Amoebophrya sp. A25]|eukprot:GSA25T00003095001.1